MLPKSRIYKKNAKTPQSLIKISLTNGDCTPYNRHLSAYNDDFPRYNRYLTMHNGDCTPYDCHYAVRKRHLSAYNHGFSRYNRHYAPYNCNCTAHNGDFAVTVSDVTAESYYRYKNFRFIQPSPRRFSAAANRANVLGKRNKRGQRQPTFAYC